MSTLSISHLTRYTYDRAVDFGPHHLMLRPRDGHDMRILDSSLTVSPRADIHWSYDTFGNSVALLTFREAADELVVSSELLLRRYGLDEPLPRIARHAGAYPVRYEADERVDLGPLIAIDRPEDAASVTGWLASVLPVPPSSSLDVLDALGEAVHRAFAYRRREERGVQSPAQTIAVGSGTCRDFAFLFMEAARALGFAARFVTGYLYDPAADAASGPAMTGGGATHAWADVFLPGAGWIEFDPTNRIVAGRNLVRVASTRTPAQALPVSGTFEATGGASCTAMEVRVAVARAP
ncbi:transglutaminase family protein [Salinarimonas ramus]|uniref:Transglutaminase n=1 Tax=Salinarimonas ramus TaxID=690164 RepID=A0A917QAC1_9HYPH|nr:transglutaminase family protein [Salinarimonas ramus]GGK38518.1 transglutaminase [Salinarimonas ramus]